MIKPDITPEAIDRLIESMKVSAVDTYLDAIAALRTQAARIAELEEVQADTLEELMQARLSCDEMETTAQTARDDALREFHSSCEDRADMMEGVEMECCRGTAMNCASDAAALIKEPTT